MTPEQQQAWVLACLACMEASFEYSWHPVFIEAEKKRKERND
jgi:hypothetical protein